jgi:peroxiredoxin Q/BCP
VSGEPLPRGPVAVGEPAPPFTLPAVTTEGTQVEVSLAAALERGPVLLIFYQDDGMPVCTRELRAFAQEHAALEAAGVQVFGINTNGLGSHTRFQERDRFPFPLISDFHGEAVRAYGLWDVDERKSRRAVVVVGRDGRVAYVQPHFNPGNVNAIVDVFAALGLA